MPGISINSRIMELAYEERDSIAKFGAETNIALADTANAVFRVAYRLAREMTPVHSGGYPPSRKRIPGTMRKSLRFYPAKAYGFGGIHPCKIALDTWLFDWIESGPKNTRKKTVQELRDRRRLQRSKALKRYKGMIKTDPRRLLGEPVQRAQKALFDKNIEEKMRKALAKSRAD